MRKPPDKDSHAVLSGRDVDSSNVTLNTLFGSSRQKSWMTGNPVRPTPRRASTAWAATPNAVPVIANSLPGVLPSPSPSDEPSPIYHQSPPSILPDVVVGQSREDDGTNTNIIDVTTPRPSSLLEENSQQASLNGTGESVIRDEFPPQQVQYDTASNECQQQRMVLDNPPLPESVLLPPTSQQATGIPSSNPEGQVGEQAQRRGSATNLHSGSSEQPFILHTEPRPMAITRHASQRVDTDGQLLSPSQTSASSPVENGIGPVSSSSNHPIDHDQLSIPRKRQRTEQTVSFLASKLGLIDDHIKAFGGPTFLNTKLERPRFQLLKEACSNEDNFYVALHQIFCTWSISHVEVFRIPKFPSFDVLQVAFNILGQLIRENDQLAPHHKQWFANFPRPLKEMVQTPIFYQGAIAKVGIFLGKLASEWAPLSRDCSSRGYPPLADELIRRLYILSPILQGVIFTATCRNLGAMTEEKIASMESVFRKDRHEHQALAWKIHTSHAPTAKEMLDRNNAIAQNYKSLVALMPNRRASQNPTPVARSPHNPSPILPGSLHQNDVSRSAAQSPALSEHSTQFPPMRRESASMVTSGSHNPPVATTAWRSPSVNGNQTAYTNLNYPTGPLQQNNNHYFPGQQSPITNSPVHPLAQNHLAQLTSQQLHPGYVSNAHLGGERNPLALYQPGSMNGRIQSQNQTRMMQAVASQQQRPLAPQPVLQSHDGSTWSQGGYFYPAATPQQAFGSLDAQHAQVAMFSQSLSSQRSPLEPNFGGVNNSSNATVSPQISNGFPPSDAHRGSMQQALHPRAVSSNMNSPIQMHGFVPSNDYMAHLRPHNLSHHRSISNGIWSNTGQSTATQSMTASNPARDGQTMMSSSHNRVASPATVNRQQQNLQAQSYANTAPLARNLIPPLAFVHPPQMINPLATALHQAHLRSPRLVPTHKIPDEVPAHHAGRRFYQIVKDFVHGPVRLMSSCPISTFECTILENDFKLLAVCQENKPGGLEKRNYTSGTLQIRLRCIRKPKEQTECSLDDWVVSDTVWPDNAYLEMQSGISRLQLEIRRKNNHGKDLPIDLTSLVRNASRDVHVTLSMPGPRLHLNAHSYFVAIEVVEVLNHAQIKSYILKAQRIAASVTLDSIKKSLTTPIVEEDDDDIALVSSDLIISLLDPFSKRIFDTPVRGNKCQHRECFDLETFLLTRNSKPGNERGLDQPSMVDVWRCPLCGKDARPYSLFVDDFLVSVRTELERTDKLDVKGIWINKDGQWRARVEPNSGKHAVGDESDSDSDEEVKTLKDKTRKERSISKQTQVIDIDDD